MANVPPILPLPEEPTDNETVLWQMIVRLRSALFGSGGAFAGSGLPFSCYDGTIPLLFSPNLLTPGTNSIAIPVPGSDKFDRVDSNTVGSSWVEKEEGSETGIFKISSNKLKISGCGSLCVPPIVGRIGFMYWDANTLNDQSSKAKIVSLGTGSMPIGLAVRINTCQAATLAKCYICVILANEEPDIRRVDSGTQINLAVGTPGTVKAGDTVELKVIGTTITLIRTKGTSWPIQEQGDVATLLTATDSTYLSGKSGFFCSESAAFAEWDDWEGDNFESEIDFDTCLGGGPIAATDEVYPGQPVIIGKYGQLSIPCNRTVIIDPVTKRFGVNVSEAPATPLDVYDGQPTNKRILAANTDELTTFTRLRLAEITTPGTPPANTLYLYAKDKSGVSGLFWKDDGGTERDLAGIAGSGAANRVAFWTDASTLSFDSNLVWDNVNKRLGLGGSPLALLDVFGKSRLSVTGGQFYEWGNRGATYPITLQGLSPGVNSVLEMFSKDGDGTDIVGATFFGQGNIDNLTNHEGFAVRYDTDLICKILSFAGGTGVVRPIRLFTGTNTTQLVLATGGQVSVGTTEVTEKLNVGGSIRFGTHSAVGVELVTGFITITDSGGTSRKLAVVS